MGTCKSKTEAPPQRKSNMSKRQNAIVEARLQKQQAKQAQAYEKKRREGLEGMGEFARGIHDARQTDSHLNALAKTTHFSLNILRQLEVLFHLISGSQVQDEMIDREELSDALGLHSDSLLARTIFRLFDVTQSAKINFRTWVITLSSLSPMATPEEKVKFSFSLYDLNGDGAIEKEELKSLLEAAVKETLSDLSDNEVRELCEETLKSVDKDGNGLVDYEEYRQMVLNSGQFLESFSIDVERLLSALQRQGSRIGVAMNILQDPAAREKEEMFRARKTKKTVHSSAAEVLQHARELGGDPNMTKVEAQEKVWAESMSREHSMAAESVWYANGGIVVPPQMLEAGEDALRGVVINLPVHLVPSGANAAGDDDLSMDHDNHYDTRRISISSNSPHPPSPHSPSRSAGAPTQRATRAQSHATPPQSPNMPLRQRQLPESESRGHSRRPSHLTVPGSAHSRTPSGSLIPSNSSLSGNSTFAGIPVMVNSGHLRPGVLLHVPSQSNSNAITPDSQSLSAFIADGDLNDSFSVDADSKTGKTPTRSPPMDKSGPLTGPVHASPNLRPFTFQLRSVSLTDSQADAPSRAESASGEHSPDTPNGPGPALDLNVSYTVKIDLENSPNASPKPASPKPADPAQAASPAPAPVTAASLFGSPAGRPTGNSPVPSSPTPTLRKTNTIPGAVSGGNISGLRPMGTVSQLSRALNAHGVAKSPSPIQTQTEDARVEVGTRSADDAKPPLTSSTSLPPQMTAKTPNRNASGSPEPFTTPKRTPVAQRAQSGMFPTSTPVVFPRIYNDNAITLTPHELSMLESEAGELSQCVDSMGGFWRLCHHV